MNTKNKENIIKISLNYFSLIIFSLSTIFNTYVIIELNYSIFYK